MRVHRPRLHVALPVALALVCTASPASGQTITEYRLPTAGSRPGHIAPGPGGMWFTEFGANRIGLITAEGRISEFPVTRPAVAIVAGPDGNLWFTSQKLLSRMTPDGVVTDFPVPGDGYGIIAGPDRTIWFTLYDEERGDFLCRGTTDGQITQFKIEGEWSASLVAGPDGNLWLTDWREFHDGGVIRVTPSGVATRFPLGSATAITVGSDGNLWLNVEGGLVRMTTAGVTAGFATRLVGGAIASGPDGNLWFAADGNRIGRLTTQGGYVSFSIPTADASPWSISAGPDGALWFTEQAAGQIGKLVLDSDSYALDLLGGRFRVELGWSSGTASGFAHPVSLTSKSGYFWFDDPANIEVVVKMLDWCPNGLLFFAAGLTSFGTTLTLTDTLTGAATSWVSAPDSVFLPIQMNLGACPQPNPIAGDWTGTFDSRDPIDCERGVPARASFQQNGTAVVGSLTVSGFCGYSDVAFQGTLLGASLTGKVTGGPFGSDGLATGTLSIGKLAIELEGPPGSGNYFYAAGSMRLQR